LVGSPIVPDGFFRTDVEFGSGDELHPMVVIGPDVGTALAAQGLRGLDLKPIEH
jgi:hypothetical protein